jgi:prepilin-type N-terminal cleavage/methylation domain-containing protein
MQTNKSIRRTATPCIRQGSSRAQRISDSTVRISELGFRISDSVGCVKRFRADAPTVRFATPFDGQLSHATSTSGASSPKETRHTLLPINPKSEIRNPKSPVNPKSGFTIIELLVVITIIAILMTLVVSVMGAFISQARDAATKSTLNKVQGLANQRAQALNRLTLRKGYVTTTDPLQKAIGAKLAERRYFPQRVIELNLADQTDLYGKYVAQFSQPPPLGQSLPNPNGLVPGDLSQYDWTKDSNHTLRSSEILYNFLTQANVIGDAPLSTDAFGTSEVVDTPEILDPVTKQLVGNGLPEFVDAWGQPLRFYRWPTRFFRSNGVIASTNPNQLAHITTPNAPPGLPGPYQNAGGTYDTNNAKLLFASLPVFSGNLASDLNRDPDDPLRVCASNVVLPSGQSFMQAFEQNFHTPATYHTLLIVSAGPDGQMGLFEPDDTNNFGNLAAPIPNTPTINHQDELADNIMYLNVRAGGK